MSKTKNVEQIGEKEISPLAYSIFTKYEDTIFDQIIKPYATSNLYTED